MKRSSSRSRPPTSQRAEQPFLANGVVSGQESFPPCVNSTKFQFWKAFDAHDLFTSQIASYQPRIYYWQNPLQIGISSTIQYGQKPHQIGMSSAMTQIILKEHTSNTYIVCKISYHSLIPSDLAGERREGYLRGISSFQASQAAEETSCCYKSSISAKGTMSSRASTKNTWQETKYLEKIHTNKYKRLQLLTTKEIHDEIFIQHVVWFVSWIIKAFLDFWNAILSAKFRLFSYSEKIHCKIQINTQYSALTSNMLWSSQILWTSPKSSVRRAWLEFEGWLGPGKLTKLRVCCCWNEA